MQERRRRGDRREDQVMPVLAFMVAIVLFMLVLMCVFNVIVRHTWGSWFLLAAVLGVAASAADSMYLGGRYQDGLIHWIRSRLR